MVLEIEPQMAETRITFKEWLHDALASRGETKRGLARKIAAKHPEGATEKTIESARTTIRKILDGSTPNPTQPTRNAIQAALGLTGAPTVEDESADAPTAHEALAQLRELRRLTFKLERSLVGGVR